MQSPHPGHTLECCGCRQEPLGSEITVFGLGDFLQTVNFTLCCKRIVLTDVADMFPVTLVHCTELPQPREVLGKSKPNGTEVMGCYYLSLSSPPSLRLSSSPRPR